MKGDLIHINEWRWTYSIVSVCMWLHNYLIKTSLRETDWVIRLQIRLHLSLTLIDPNCELSKKFTESP